MKKLLNNISRTYTLTLTLLLLNILSVAQPFNPGLASKLQAKLDSLRTAFSIRGISASVIYPGQGLWQGVSGVSHNGVNISREMEFGIGSNTKLFTAVALLKLAEREIVAIDDSLYKWLPPIANVGPHITIRLILNHTSGIADFTECPGYSDSILSNPSRVFYPTELLTWIGPPLFPAGTNGSYSNSNYLIAGLVFQQASGQNIATFIRDSILTPLNMDSTFFDVQEPGVGVVAHPWQNGNDINNVPRISLNSSSWTAGAMYSTSGEMSCWYKAIMDGQVLNLQAPAITGSVLAGRY
jgi:D-alanyl-D-alanine carboxypeptidase